MVPSRIKHYDCDEDLLGKKNLAQIRLPLVTKLGGGGVLIDSGSGKILERLINLFMVRIFDRLFPTHNIWPAISAIQYRQDLPKVMHLVNIFVLSSSQ